MLVVFHLIHVQVIEQREGINQEVTRTAGRIEQSHLAQVLWMAHLMVREISYQVFLFDTAVWEHLHISLTQRIVNKELHYPLGRINLTLKRYLIIFCLLATLLQCFFLYGIEVLVEPAKDVVTLPYISSTVSIRFYGIELLDNLIQFIGSRQQCVWVVLAIKRDMLTKVVELVAKEMLQSLTFRIALLWMVLQPYVVFKGTSCILLPSGDNLRKQFL